MQAFVAHGTRDLADWLNATQDMSNPRVQLILAIDNRSLKPFLARLQEFVTKQAAINAARQAFLANRASLTDVMRAQSEYVQIGHTLLMEVTNAIGSGPIDEVPLTRQELDELASSVAEPLEKSSVVSVSYGKQHRSSTREQQALRHSKTHSRR